MAHPIIVACMLVTSLAALTCIFFPNVFWQTQNGVGSDDESAHPSSDDYWVTLTNFFRC